MRGSIPSDSVSVNFEFYEKGKQKPTATNLGEEIIYGTYGETSSRDSFKRKKVVKDVFGEDIVNVRLKKYKLNDAALKQLTVFIDNANGNGKSEVKVKIDRSTTLYDLFGGDDNYNKMNEAFMRDFRISYKIYICGFEKDEKK